MEIKEKTRSKKRFGMRTGILIAAIVLMVSVSAVLIQTYGNVETTATVSQAVILTSNNPSETTCTNNACDHNIGAVSGSSTYRYCDINIENAGNNPAPIKFETTVVDSGNNSVINGVDVKYFSILELENKDSDWNVILGDDVNGTLEYELSSNTFNYHFEAEGLTPDVEYSLIYYADKPNRFNYWQGDNPGALIGTGMLEYGLLVMDDSVNLEMNLPYIDDWNYNPTPNYCPNQYDDFGLCSGAKVWLVPSIDYDASNTKLIAWNPTTYLFETNLITYDDKNHDRGEALYVGHGNFDVCIEVTFGAIIPDTYTITTDVTPA